MGRNRHVPTEKINSKIRKQIISTLSGNKKPLEFKNPNGSFIIYRKTLLMNGNDIKFDFLEMIDHF